jgi:hypothetical protein
VGARLYELVAELPLEVESYELERLEQTVSSGFTRVTTVIRLRGGGHDGVGEDIVYDGDAQREHQEAGPVLPLTAARTFDEFSRLLDRVELFAGAAPNDLAHRRWGYESAALDLALRQAGRPLADVLGRPPQPVRFVVSMRLGTPPSVEAVRQWRALYPALGFKLDPTSDWTRELADELASLGAVAAVDLKGLYRGTVVDQPPDPALYELVATAFADAWIEDPALTPETEQVLEPYRDRITWDAAIHSVDDVLALPFPPRMLNVKPSRFGSVAMLFDFYDHCEANGIQLYGGGQFELGPGRGQIQYLASLFHPDAPNDVAPSAYNVSGPQPGLPESPLEPTPAPIGFRWGNER